MEAVDKKTLEKMQAKEKKWFKMVQEWEKSEQEPADLKSRIWKGCPNSLRGRVWPQLLKLQQIKEINEKALGPDLYERMKQTSKKRSSHRDIVQIDLDIHRTFRNHEMFQLKYDVMQQKLFNVLSAYSVFNTSVGYCQAMSSLAAFLLMYLKEEEVFWALTSLLRSAKYQMNNLYVQDLEKLHRLIDHHLILRKKFTHTVHKHLKKQEFIPSLYVTRWFMKNFLDSVPFSLNLRMWDIFLYEGEEISIAMSLCILRTFKKTLVKLNMEQLQEFFQVLPEKQLDEEKLLDNLMEILSELRRSRMSVLAPLPPIQPVRTSESMSTLPSNKVNKVKLARR
eukprot:sb/3466515/